MIDKYFIYSNNPDSKLGADLTDHPESFFDLQDDVKSSENSIEDEEVGSRYVDWVHGEPLWDSFIWSGDYGNLSTDTESDNLSSNLEGRGRRWITAMNSLFGS